MISKEMIREPIESAQLIFLNFYFLFCKRFASMLFLHPKKEEIVTFLICNFHEQAIVTTKNKNKI